MKLADNPPAIKPDGHEVTGTSIVSEINNEFSISYTIVTPRSLAQQILAKGGQSMSVTMITQRHEFMQGNRQAAPAGLG